MDNKLNLNKLQFISDKNKTNLKNKSSKPLDNRPSSEFLSKSILVHETDWSVCKLEKINEAVSTTIDELLPEKAKYEYSFELDIPENYLHYLNFNVLAKTIPEQQIVGVGTYDFTSLREILLNTFSWNGVLYSEGLVAQGQSYPPVPPPGAYYDTLVETVDYGGIFFTHWLYLFTAYSTVFPAPAEIGTPGGDDGWGTWTWNETEFDQSWTNTGQTTFQGLLGTYTYEEASDIMSTYYPNIIITAEDDGPPWKCYELITNKTVQTSDKQVLITKVGTNRFSFKISGHFMLISKAIDETSWSDPDVPTYEPRGSDMHTRLKVFFDAPLTMNVYKRYTK
jgi:hypothetical protein